MTLCLLAVAILATISYTAIGRPGDAKYTCANSCMNTFVKSLQSRNILLNEDLCEAYMDLQGCMVNCSNGEKLISGTSGMAARFSEALVSSCDEEKANEPVDPSILKDMMGEGKGLKKMDNCVKGCESVIRKHMLTTTTDISKACTDWDEYKRCIKQCPGGEKAFSVAKKTFSNMFDTIETACSQPRISNSVNPDLASNTDMGLQSQFNYSTANIACLDKCSRKLMETADAEFSSRAHVCNKWREDKRCYLSCDGGDQFLQRVLRIVPKLYKFLKDMCSDSSVDKEVDLTLLLDMLGEAKKAKEIERCMTNCETHVQGILVNLGNQGAICEIWFNYEKCLLRCPYGAMMMEVVKKSFSQIFDAISSRCGDAKSSLQNPLPSGSAGKFSETMPLILLTNGAKSPLRRLACLQGCKARLVGLRGPEVHSCKAQADVDSCFRSCEDGNAILAMLVRVAPKSHQIGAERCNDTSDTDSIDPDVLSDIVGEGRGAKDLELCVKECESHAMNIIGSAANLVQMCSAWYGFQSCFTACHGSEVVVGTVKANFLDLFSMVETTCAKQPALPPATHNVDQTNRSLTTRTGSLTLASSAKNLNCIRVCSTKIDALLADNEKTEGEFCKGWQEAKYCFGSCHGGDALLSGVARTVPKSYKMVEELCSNPDDNKSLDPQLTTSIRNEGKNAEIMGECVSDCNNNILPAMHDSAGNLTQVCSTWFHYEKCILNCPKGAMMMETAKKNFSEMYNTIKNGCGSANPIRYDTRADHASGNKQKPVRAEPSDVDSRLPKPTAEVGGDHDGPSNSSQLPKGTYFGHALVLLISIIGLFRSGI